MVKYVQLRWLPGMVIAALATVAVAKEDVQMREEARPQSQHQIAVEDHAIKQETPLLLAQVAVPAPVRTVLTQDVLKGALTELPGWTVSPDGKSISKDFEFKNFNEAFGFMTRIALVAEQLNHHPQWSNVYKLVKIKLATYHEDAVTDLDIALGKSIEQIATGK